MFTRTTVGIVLGCAALVLLPVASAVAQTGCGDPATGSCFEPHDWPYCDDYDCCNMVCAQEPLCCQEAWGAACVKLAEAICQAQNFIEVDRFDFSIGQLELVRPDGSSETVAVSGDTTVHVFFEGAVEGDALDNDGDTRDEVVAQMVDLNLTGTSSMGPVTVRVHPTMPSMGEIEETANPTPGLLDLPPFAPDGTADSFFDIFFEIELGGQLYYTIDPKRMSSLITHKPPGPGDLYENLQQIELYDENGEPTGFFLGATRHVPHPEIAIIRIAKGLGPDPTSFISPKSKWKGLDSVEMLLTYDVTLLSSCTTSTGGSPPNVQSLVQLGSRVHLLLFDGPIEVGHWTTVTLRVQNPLGEQGVLCLQVAQLPDDCDQNEQVNLNDATEFGRLFKAGGPLLLGDLNADGQINLNDATDFGNIGNGKNREGSGPNHDIPWLGQGLPPRPPCVCPGGP